MANDCMFWVLLFLHTVNSKPLKVIFPSVTLPTICLSNTYILHYKTMS